MKDGQLSLQQPLQRGHVSAWNYNLQNTGWVVVGLLVQKTNIFYHYTRYNIVLKAAHLLCVYYLKLYIVYR